MELIDAPSLRCPQSTSCFASSLPFFLPADHRGFQRRLWKNSGHASRCLQLVTGNAPVCGTTLGRRHDGLCRGSRLGSARVRWGVGDLDGASSTNRSYHCGRSADLRRNEPPAAPTHPPPPPSEDGPGPRDHQPFTHLKGSDVRDGTAQDSTSGRPGLGSWVALGSTVGASLFPAGQWR